MQRVVHNLTSALPGYYHCIVTTGPDGAIQQQKNREGEIIRCRAYAEIASMPIAPTLFTKVLGKVRQVSLIAIHYPFPLAEAVLLLTPFAPPIVVHWHSEVIAQHRLKWLVAPFTLLMLLRAKAIVVTSDRMLENSFHLKLFKRKIHFIPYGIPAISVGQSPTIAEPEYFLLIGRHVSYKGIAYAIKAMSKLNHRLIIVGDGPLFEQHKELVDELNLSKQVQFERYAEDDQVTTLIRSAIALIVPSILENEAFALVQLEAMRLGKPVINTSLQSSVPWVARHQQEAITIPPKDATALAAAMRSLVDNSVLRKKLGKAALLRFNHEFRADTFAARISQLYTSLIAK